MKLDRSLWKRALRRIGSVRDPGMHAEEFEVPLSSQLSELASSPYGAVLVQHTGRTAWKWTHYAQAYSSELGRFRGGFPEKDGRARPLKVLEVGVLHGGSLQVWRKFFGADALIVGIDIEDHRDDISDPELDIRIGSQADPSFLRRVVREMGGVDVVLDDGSHVVADQRKSFEVLFPLLSDGGVYLVEDLHTSYWANYGGGYGAPASFIEFVKSLIDDMHVWYHSRGDATGMSAANHIPRITIYDSLVAIQKESRSRPANVRIGTDAF